MEALVNTYWELWFKLDRERTVSFKLKGKVVSRYWVGEISYYDNGEKTSVPWYVKRYFWDIFEMDFFDSDWEPDNDKLNKKLIKLKEVDFWKDEKLFSLYILSLLSFFERVIEKEDCPQDICDY